MRVEVAVLRKSVVSSMVVTDWSVRQVLSQL